MAVERLPGDPKRGRHIRGIPKAGPLYVNGKRVPKGNVPQAVKRIYRARAPQLGPDAPKPSRQRRQAHVNIEVETKARCEWCGNGADRGEDVIVDLATGEWWHFEPDRGSTCMQRWLLDQIPDEGTG